MLKKPPQPPHVRSTPLVPDFHFENLDRMFGVRGQRPDTGSYRAPPTVLNDALALLGYVGLGIVGGIIGSAIGGLIWPWLA